MFNSGLVGLLNLLISKPRSGGISDTARAGRATVPAAVVAGLTTGSAAAALTRRCCFDGFAGWEDDEDPVLGSTFSRFYNNNKLNYTPSQAITDLHAHDIFSLSRHFDAWSYHYPRFEMRGGERVSRAV